MEAYDYDMGLYLGWGFKLMLGCYDRAVFVVEFEVNFDHNHITLNIYATLLYYTKGAARAAFSDSGYRAITSSL